MFSRVTNSMMTTTFINDIQRNLKKTTELQHQISTGKKVNNPSDDPIGADRILDYRQIVGQTEQFMKNVDDADTLASNIDTVFGNMEDILLRVRDLSVRASNEAVNNQQDLDAIAGEIDSLIMELVNQANQKFDGKYLFSGNKTTTTPFVARTYVDFTYGGVATAAGNPPVPPLALNMASYTIDGAVRTSQAITDASSVTEIVIVDSSGNRNVLTPADFAIDPATNQITVNNLPVNLASTDKIEVHFSKVVSVEYQGNAGIKEVQISNGSQVGVSYIGASADQSVQSSVFGKYSSSGNETASVEAFQKLMDLRDNIYKYKNVPNGNLDDITTGIDDVDSIRENITTVRSEQGGRVNRLELAKNRLSSIKINTTALMSAREDVDMAEAISNLTLAQNIYEACLGAGARIISTTLLDYLR